MALQFKLAKMVKSELGNLIIDWEELIGRLRETRHDVQDLMGRLSAVELAATKLVDHSYTDEEQYGIMKLKFDLNDPRGVFKIIVSEIAAISNKLESGYGVDIQGYALSNYIDAAQWFKDHKGVIGIFVDGVAMLHDMIAPVTHTAEANRAKKSAKKIDMGSELEAVITASFSIVLTSILVVDMKEVTGGVYDCLVDYLKNYSLWSPHGTEGSSGIKART